MKRFLLGIIFFLAVSSSTLLTVKAETKEVTLGNGGQYANLNELFDDDSIAGDVIVTLVSNVTDTIVDTPLIVPAEYESLTLQSLTGNDYQLFIDQASGVAKLQALYMNGADLTIAVVISNSSYSGSISVFAGGYYQDVDASSFIHVNKPFSGTIYGGGFNSNMTGDTEITIDADGTNMKIYGGGLASAPDTYQTDTPNEAQANVTGNRTITISEAASATIVYGGGRAMTTNRSASITTYRAIADVNGDINIFMDGKTQQIYGGGYAGHEAVMPETNYETYANVHGAITITYGAEASASSINMKVYGGGVAQASNSHETFAQANVIGQTNIISLLDASASLSQNNNQSFSRLFGGGMADGNSAQANIEGNTFIETARVCWESHNGMFGGGWALRGGTANVSGQTSISLHGIEGQRANYENANGVFGGGYAGGGSPKGNPSTADVGSTLITVYPGARLTSGSSNGASIIAGGMADEEGANARVLQNTSIIILGDIYDEMPIYGGGLAMRNKDNADVLGNTSIEIQGAIASSYTSSVNGGGYARAAGAVADVKGDTFLQIKGTEDQPISVTQSLYGAGKAESNASAKVEGSSLISLQHIKDADAIWVKGSGSGSGKSDVQGEKRLEISGNVVANLLYDFTDVTFLENAYLELMDTGNSNVLFMIKKMTLPPSATFAFHNNASLIDFEGGGTLIVPNNKYFYATGFVSNTTNVKIDGVINSAQSTVFTLKKGDGDFRYIGEEPYYLLKEEDDTYYRWNPISLSAPTIMTDRLADGLESTPYYQELTADSPVAVTWSIDSGSLPIGLTLSKEGIIQGTPEMEGVYTFVVKAMNAPTLIATKQMQIKIEHLALAPTITTQQLNDAITSKPYSQSLQASGDTPFTWNMESGTLPNGLTLRSDGLISGIPNEIGDFKVEVAVHNAAGRDVKEYMMTVHDLDPVPPLEFITTSFEQGQYLVEYKQQIQVKGTPIKWEITQGKLPAGMILTQDGMIQGTPNEAGEYPFTLRISNRDSFIEKDFTIIIQAPKTFHILNESLINGILAQTYREELRSNSISSVIWSISEGSLPEGLQLSDNIIQGIPKTFGTFHFKIKAENAEHSIEKAFTIVIEDIRIIEGANSVWVSDNKTDLVFASNGSFDNFMNVTVDDKLVDEKYYTAKRGSTIITLTAEYLATLESGEHILRINYNDTISAETLFVIKDEKTEEIPSGENEAFNQTPINPITQLDDEPNTGVSQAVAITPADGKLNHKHPKEFLYFLFISNCIMLSYVIKHKKEIL